MLTNPDPEIVRVSFAAAVLAECYGLNTDESDWIERFLSATTRDEAEIEWTILYGEEGVQQFRSLCASGTDAPLAMAMVMREPRYWNMHELVARRQEPAD